VRTFTADDGLRVDLQVAHEFVEWPAQNGQGSDLDGSEQTVAGGGIVEKMTCRIARHRGWIPVRSISSST